jgi:hypothetical protein
MIELGLDLERLVADLKAHGWLPEPLAVRQVNPAAIHGRAFGVWFRPRRAPRRRETPA